MDVSPRYRWELLPRLAEEVAHGRVDEVRRLIPELLAAVEVFPEADFLKLRCAQCASACLRGAQRGGADSERLYLDHLAMLRRLARLRTHAAIRRLFTTYVLRLADQGRPAARTLIERAVRAVMADQAATLARPRTLAAYARGLGLSQGHFSRAFARIAGRSFRAEQARLRDAAACELLAATTLPLAEVAARVGLCSASQFIAAFRRAHRLTPDAWRRRHGHPALRPG